MSLRWRMRFLMLSGHLQARGTASRSVVCDDAGVSQVDWQGGQEVQHRLGWDEVGRVFAYREDAHPFNRISVALTDRDGTFRLKVSDEHAGFLSLIDELPRRLDGCLAPDGWLDSLPIIGGDPHMIELYRHPPAPTSSAP